nr:unnamed protein product [Digitaria exilis]CAB3502505.1 unnamed protein product [Digitaria exilis]CAB3502509.1 unnamed protein product [Digitaria exilis]
MGERAELHVQLRLAWSMARRPPMRCEGSSFVQSVARSHRGSPGATQQQRAGDVGGVARSIVSTKSNKILANIAIKINAMVGGRSSVFVDAQKSLPVVSNKPTIIFGVDVILSASLDASAPSIASVVASQDWHEVLKYNGPPVHYAHKLAHRARLYLAQGSEAATTVSSGGATAPTGGSKQIPEIKDALKRSMFYC